MSHNFYVTPVEVAQDPRPSVNSQGLTNVINYVGEDNVPRNIRRQRKSNLDAMRRFGSPVIVKHMYNDDDVQKGLARKSPNFSDVYGQTRHDDPLSHGVGLVGMEDSIDEWYTPQGRLTTAYQTGYTAAPKYRGYGPGYLTYAIMPDVSEDVFKLTETGALIRTQQAQVQMGWYPEVNDNDLLITCQVDNGMNVIKTMERYLLKMTNPASMRGLDRRGRREYSEDFGNRHVTDQSFEMTLLPQHDKLYDVEIDR